MKDFTIKPAPVSGYYNLYTGDGRIVTETPLIRIAAQLLMSALNNFILISNYNDLETVGYPPSVIAEMFLSDVFAMLERGPII